jgi:D-threo-aldose 1-dehydrogenase
MSDGGPEPEVAGPEVAGPRALPKSGLGLSALGLGTAWIGERGNPGGADGAVATVDRALAQGLSYVDTAPHYGIGLAERRIGPALAGRPRESFAVSTKVGRVISEQAGSETFDFSAAAIRASLAGSLDRLGLAAVDVVYVHDPDFAEEEARAAAFPVLREWRRDGAVTAIGAGMNQAAMLDRFVTDPDLDLDVVLLAGRYTLLDQSGLTLLGHCLERGVGVVLGGVFNSGILADPRPGATYDYQRAPGELVARARAMAAVCERHGVPLPAAALQFGWGHPAVVSVLNGPANPAELAANLEFATTAIPAACWDQLRAEGLLAPPVPVPGEG